VPNPQDMQPQDQRLALMSHALDFVRESIPDRDIILVDYQTRLLLGYYLGRGDADKSYERRGPYLEFKYGGKRVVSAGEATWNFTDGSFEAELDRLAKVFDLEPGDRVWVVDAGCFPRLTPGSGDTTFGANIEVLRRTVGRGPEAVGSLLELAARLAEQGITARISLWPGAELTGPARRAAAAVSNRALTYEEAYRAMGRGEFDFGDLLPALAFWEFGSAERHPEAMRYMDEGENYISAGLRFTLLLTSADGRAAVYLVEEAGDGRRR
jgi:hypothetical protein